MARERLIGFYGKYAQAVLGAEETATTLTADTYYVVTGLGGTGIPAGAELGYVFLSNAETISGADAVKELTLTDLCDIQSWSMEFSKAEVDVTTLCDDQNKYLAGRDDVTGSVEGVYTIGVTDTDGGLANAFFDIVRQTGAGGAITIDHLDSEPIVAILYKQKLTDAGETEQFYIAPATVTSFSDSVSGADAQSFSSSFRIAPNDEINFQLVSVTHT